jgi:hypothetical protein
MFVGISLMTEPGGLKAATFGIQTASGCNEYPTALIV